MCVFCNTSVYLVGSRSAGFSLCTTRWKRSQNGLNVAFKLLRSLVYARNLFSGLVRLVQSFDLACSVAWRSQSYGEPSRGSVCVNLLWQ